MILNKARKNVEGISRNIPYSKVKEIRRSAKLYWKYKVKQLNNKQIDEDALWKYKTIANICHEENISLQEAKEEWKKTKEQQQDIIVNRKKHQEKYLMDFNENDIEENTEIQ